jgi:RHS repeat-associated protein
MPRWWVDEPYINLHVVDEPLSHITSAGKNVPIRFTYKQDYMLPQGDQIPSFYGTYFDYSRDREIFTGPYIYNMQNHAGIPSFYGFAEATNGMTNAAWIHNYQEFMVLWDANWETNYFVLKTAPTAYSDLSYEALVFMPDGGIDYFTQNQGGQTLNSTTQSRDQVSQVQLQAFPNVYKPTPFYSGTRDGNGVFWGTGTNGMKLVYPDGSQDVFGLTFWAGGGSSSVPDSTACALLTSKIDPQGRVTQLGYVTNAFTNTCDGATYWLYRLRYVLDPDGYELTFIYSTNSPELPSQLQEIDDGIGRKVTFAYASCSASSQRGWLTNITDAQGNSSSFTYQSGNNGLISSLVTPYGTNNFYYQQVVETDEPNAYQQRVIYATEPEGASQLFCYIHNTSGNVESTAIAPTVSGQTFDDGTTGGIDEALYHRNSFYWGRSQTAALSTGVTQYLPSNLALAISSLSAADLKKGRLQHWLLDTDGISITETLSSERDPSPDSAGTIEGQRQWYAYGNTTPADQYASDSVTAIAKLLPDGTSNYTRYVYSFSAPWVVTQNAQSYSKSDGTFGELLNYFVYDPLNFVDVLTISNSLGQFAKLTYNTSHEVIGITNALNQVTSVAYDSSFFNITNIAFDSGKTISLHYNTSGNSYLSNIVIQPENLTITVPSGFGWDGYCNPDFSICGFLPLIVEVTGAGLPTLWLTNTWDNLNRLTGVTYPDGTTISNIYTYLDLTARKDRLGNWTYYTYDGLEHLTSITDARNNITQFTWCSCGALTSISNALGHITSLNYNNQELLTNASFPDSSSLNWQYDTNSRVTNVFDGAGNAVQFAYNNQNLVTSVKNTYGQIWGAYLDAIGRPVAVTNVNNAACSNNFDLLNRVTNRFWFGGSNEYFGYATNGLIAYTNQDSQWTHFGRDGAERLIALTNASQVNFFAWNGLDDLTNLTDGLNHTTTWTYNQYGWLTSKSNTLAVTAMNYARDADGRATNRWMSGTNTAYSYDAVGNLTSIVYPGQTNTYHYDALNELTNMTDPSGTSAFTYSPNSLISSETGPWSSDTINYGYNQGHRTSLSLTEASGGPWSQTYGYDAAWRMTGITSPAGTFNYTPGAAGGASPLIQSLLLPNYDTITNTYDSLARLKSTALLNQWGHVLDGYVYGVDSLGLRTNITRELGLTTNTVAVGYDPINQMSSWTAKEASGATRHNEQLGYGYDAAGNLNLRTNDALVQTFTVDSLNQLSSVSRTGAFTVTGATPAPANSITVDGVLAQTYGDFTFAGGSNTLANGVNTFTIIGQNEYGLGVTNALTLNLPTPVSPNYDANGNLTSDDTRVFTYDAENQLTNVAVAGQWQVGFIYDGLRRKRIERDYAWVSSAWQETNETRYLYDGNLVIQERDTNNNVHVTYTRGLDLSLSREGAGGIGGLLARTDSSGSYYYHSDGSGNVTALVDANGIVQARAEYDAFGKMLKLSGPLSAKNRYWFSSKEFIPQAGIYSYGYRFYEPNFQRWLNRDPLQETYDINLYRFNYNSPLAYVDTDGQSPLGIMAGGGTGAAIGYWGGGILGGLLGTLALPGGLTIAGADLGAALGAAVGGSLGALFGNSLPNTPSASAASPVSIPTSCPKKISPPSGAPPVAVPGAPPGTVWSPTGPQRDGNPSWVPQPSVPNPNGGQPNASWDPNGGHWDVQDGEGGTQRYDWRGNPISPGQAHNPNAPSPPGNNPNP